MHITQLGHVWDLAQAMTQIIGNDQAIGQIYNISGDRFVTFDGLARACAVAAGKSADDVKIVHYDPKKFDFGKRKAFPMRVQHFFASVNKAQIELNWQPKYDLISGLQNSLVNDYLINGQDKLEVDFSVDDEILKAG
jgi:nucleoside-diphosphate-sugar epimerase